MEAKCPGKDSCAFASSSSRFCSPRRRLLWGGCTAGARARAGGAVRNADVISALPKCDSPLPSRHSAWESKRRQAGHSAASASSAAGCAGARGPAVTPAPLLTDRLRGAFTTTWTERRCFSPTSPNYASPVPFRTMLQRFWSVHSLPITISVGQTQLTSASRAAPLSPSWNASLLTSWSTPIKVLNMFFSPRYLINRKRGKTTSHSNGFPDCYSFSVKILRLYLHANASESMHRLKYIHRISKRSFI